METIPKSKCQKIGSIRKTHGVYGELLIDIDTEYELSLENIETVFIEAEGLLVPFFPEEDGFRSITSKSAVVALDDIKNKEQAERFVGLSVWLSLNDIQKSESKSTSESCLNYNLIDEYGNDKGTIVAIDDYSGNIVFTVKKGEQEVLVPFNYELLIKTDKEKKSIVLHIPDGLFED